MHRRGDAGCCRSGNTDAEQGNQHRTEGHEAGEVGDEILDDSPQPLGVEQADGLDACARTGGGPNVFDGNAQPAG